MIVLELRIMRCGNFLRRERDFDSRMGWEWKSKTYSHRLVVWRWKQKHMEVTKWWCLRLSRLSDIRKGREWSRVWLKERQIRKGNENFEDFVTTEFMPDMTGFHTYALAIALVTMFLPFAPATTDQTRRWERCHITADLRVSSVSTGLLQLTVSRPTTHLPRTTTASTERRCSSGA